MPRTLDEIISEMPEADRLEIERRTAEIIAESGVTESCGCVFADLECDPPDGHECHMRPCICGYRAELLALGIGIATYEQQKAQLMAIASGDRKLSPGEPTLFVTPEFAAKFQSAQECVEHMLEKELIAQELSNLGQEMFPEAYANSDFSR